MTTDDSEAQRKRAAALRQQIGRMTGRPSDAEQEKPPNAGVSDGSRSPRSLIEEKMRELDGERPDKPDGGAK